MNARVFDYTDRWGDRLLITDSTSESGNQGLDVRLHTTDWRLMKTRWWMNDVRRLHKALAGCVANPPQGDMSRTLWQAFGDTGAELKTLRGTADLWLKVGDTDSVRLSWKSMKAFMNALGGWLVVRDLSGQQDDAPAMDDAPDRDDQLFPQPGLAERVAALEETVARLTAGIADLLVILKGGHGER